MSGMAWEITTEQCKRGADEYARKLGHLPGSEKYSDRYNGYFAGYMENAAERESLRVILARKQKEEEELLDAL